MHYVCNLIFVSPDIVIEFNLQKVGMLAMGKTVNVGTHANEHHTLC